MEFLADESCAAPVIKALRAAGHDVLSIAESDPGTSDEQVLACALSENRVLITEDRDFGELIYARGHSSSGVMLLRFHTSLRVAKAATVVDAVARLGARLRNSFTVVEAGRVRISSRP